MFECATRFVKAECSIDDRVNLVKGERPVHGLEHRDGPDEDAAYARVALGHRAQGEVRQKAGNAADEVELSAEAERGQGTTEGVLDPNVENVIDPAPVRKLADAILPLDVGLVVGRFVRTEGLRTGELLVLARGDDNPCTRELGELETED